MDFQNMRPDSDGKLRIVQELVPGKQITLAHVVASPDPVLYRKLGLDPSVDYAKSAIGILTVSPAETAIIASDLAIKASGAEIGFVDRFSGTVIVTGTVSEVEAAMVAMCDYCRDRLGFTVCPITKT
ncbi:MAG: BMC domain-containing protein [Clostridia bacterium]|nr:BMC domain-containing protein [Clostridia bacterium]